METKVSEIANGIYRLSTFVPQIAPPAGFAFNQFLILGDEPLLFHTGLRKMFPLTRDAVSRIMPPEARFRSELARATLEMNDAPPSPVTRASAGAGVGA